MAVRHFEAQDMVISVKLKSGRLYSTRDIPEKPLGDMERIVSFFDGDRILCYSLNDVEYFEFHNKN